MPIEETPAPANEEATYLKGLDALLKGDSPEPEPEPEPEPAADPNAEPAAAAVEEPADAKGEEDAEDGEPGDEKDEDEDEGEPKVDKEALRKLQKEKRGIEQHKTEVLELERTVKEREVRVEKGERELKDFFGELNASPVETLLRHSLIPEADLQYWARQFHLLSPEALKDPRSKPEAERLRRERDRDQAARRNEAAVKKLERERDEDKVAQAEERQLNDYVTRLDASVSAYKAKTPLLVKAMAKDPAATKAELYTVAYELAKAGNGQFAEPGKVLLAWEKQQRARLERFGISLPVATAAPATQTNKAKSKTAAKSQGQSKKGGAAGAAAEDEAVLEGEAYLAELARRLKSSG